jgi:DNA-binding NarL/FixJ family response regulator
MVARALEQTGAEKPPDPINSTWSFPNPVPQEATAVTNPFDQLSARERQIAGSVAKGRSNKEIARELEISPWTVSSHLRQIFAKLGICRRIELCMLWYRAHPV